jgi:hypothetical protein
MIITRLQGLHTTAHKAKQKRHIDAFFIKRDEVKHFRDDQRCIKAAMINSRSPDIAAMLIRDPIHGFAKLEPAEIVQKTRVGIADRAPFRRQVSYDTSSWLAHHSRPARR